MTHSIRGSSTKAWRKLLEDQRGNVLMFYGFAVIPLTFSVGMGIDYARAMTTQTKLNAAADAAALNSVSQTMMIQSTTSACDAARALFEAQSADIADVEIDSVTYSIKNADGTEIGCENITDDSAPVDKRYVTVAYSARSTNLFGGILGWPALTISGSSGTYASVAPDIDFYIALDTSPSMALPTTSGGIKTLQDTIGCTFACHSNRIENNIQNKAGHMRRLIVDGVVNGIDFKLAKGDHGKVQTAEQFCKKPDRRWKATWGGGYWEDYCAEYETVTYTIIDSSGRYVYDNKPFASGTPQSCNVDGQDKCVRNPNPAIEGTFADSYWYALNRGIRLRVTDERYAVQDLLTLAETYAKLNKADYQAALFTFDHAANEVKSVATLSSDLQAVSSAAVNVNLAVVNDKSSNGCPLKGCNKNHYLFTSYASILNKMSTIDDPGMGTKSPGDKPQAFLFLVTDGMSDEYSSIKDISGSNRTRSEMTEDHLRKCRDLKDRGVQIAILYTEYTWDSVKDDDDTYKQRTIVQNSIPKIEGALAECASPGLMYTVRTNESISNALQALFSRALASARIIQ